MGFLPVKNNEYNSENQRLHASLHLASYSAYRGSFSHEFHHELLNDGTVTLIGPKSRIPLLGDWGVDEVGMDGMTYSLPQLRIVPTDRFKPYCNIFSRFLAADWFGS